MKALHDPASTAPCERTFEGDLVGDGQQVRVALVVLILVRVSTHRGSAANSGTHQCISGYAQLRQHRGGSAPVD